jgi:Xaa-Pro dipeptidase
MLAFSRDEYAHRGDRLQQAIRNRGLDALILTEPENICYVSGFWTPGYHVLQALVVPARGEPYLVLRNIETDNAAQRSVVSRVHPVDNLDRAIEVLAEALHAEGAQGWRIGVEVDLARQSMLRLDRLAALCPSVRFEPAENVVEPLRAIKSEAEVGYIRRAVDMADAAVRAGVRALGSSQTDSDVAAVVAAELARQGSEFTGSPPYVVAGRASERSHQLHARRPLDADGRCWIEVSGSCQRYHGVSGRTVGLALPQLVHELYRGVAESVAAVVGHMRPGMAAAEVDAVARAPLQRRGIDHLWRNRAAYSLGLSFPPGLGEGHIIDIKPGDRRVIRAGMVFHVIPIVKVPGIGTIGCSETVAVLEDRTERLGSLPLAALQPDDLA